MSEINCRAVLCLMVLGCAPNIGDRLSDSGDNGSDIVNVENAGGTTTTTIDSTDYKVWMYLDFESGELLPVQEPENDQRWDLGFQRYKVKLNGGVSGSGEMEVAVTNSVAFDDVVAAPDGEYFSDLADADEDGVPEYAMAAWYNYDPSTHILTPAEQVYVLRTVEGGYVKFRFDDYYDEAGTSGFLQFTWGFVGEPTGEGDIWEGGNPTDDDGGDDNGDDDVDKSGEDDSAVNCSSDNGLVSTTDTDDGYLSDLDTSASDVWTCLSLASGAQVSENWSMAWQQWTIALPMGSAGVVLESEDFETLTQAPSEGWSWDNMSLFDDWYDYNPVSHVITPRDFIYVIQDPEGHYWKLQVTSYYDESDNLHRPTMRWAEIDAPK